MAKSLMGIRCPRCGNTEDDKFSILGYTNAFKVPSTPSGSTLAVIKCEAKPCQHEFEKIIYSKEQ